MTRKDKGSVGSGRTRRTTTIAYLESLAAWQTAVGFTAAAPQPLGLFARRELIIDAASDLKAAAAWVEFLGQVERGNEEIIAEARQRGAGDHAVANHESVLLCIRAAQRYAKEHVAELERPPSSGRSR